MREILGQSVIQTPILPQKVDSETDAFGLLDGWAEQVSVN